MLMQSKATAAAVALGGALTIFAGPAMAKSPLTTVHCGQTLTQSVKLANDLTNCPAPGLAIGASAMTVRPRRAHQSTTSSADGHLPCSCLGIRT